MKAYDLKIGNLYYLAKCKESFLVLCINYIHDMNVLIIDFLITTEIDKPCKERFIFDFEESTNFIEL